MSDSIKNDLKVMKQKERQKVLSSFFTNIKFSKITFIFMLIVGSLNNLLFCRACLQNNGIESDSLLNAVVGYCCICVCLGQEFYMSANKIKNSNANKISTESSDKKAYETIAILPVKKKEIIKMDIKILSSICAFLVVSLIVGNIMYLINSNLKNFAGCFVIITLSSVNMVVGDFLSRYYYKRIGYIMELFSVVILFLVVAVNFIMSFNSKLNEIANSFLGLYVFRLLAGTPMIVLCLLVIPRLYMIYQKTDFDKGKMAVWNC